MELKIIAALLLVAGLAAGFASWLHGVKAEAIAGCNAQHDAADAAALRSNLAEQEKIRRRAADMVAGVHRATPLVRANADRLFDALARPEVGAAPPPGSASAASQPDLRSDVLGEIKDRLAGLALEADLRGVAGTACEQSYPVK